MNKKLLVTRMNTSRIIKMMMIMIQMSRQDGLLGLGNHLLGCEEEIMSCCSIVKV